MSSSETQRLEQQIYLTEEQLRLLRNRLKYAKSSPTSPPDPEDLIQGYPWPSSRITRADMIRLTEIRELTRKPITKLLHAAVAAYYRLFTEASENAGLGCCENPQLRWKSESPSERYIGCLSCGFVLSDDGQLADWLDRARVPVPAQAPADGPTSDLTGP